MSGCAVAGETPAIYNNTQYSTSTCGRCSSCTTCNSSVVAVVAVGAVVAVVVVVAVLSVVVVVAVVAVVAAVDVVHVVAVVPVVAVVSLSMGTYERRFRRAFFIKSSIFQRNRRFSQSRIRTFLDPFLTFFFYQVH